jgi:TonB family protein
MTNRAMIYRSGSRWQIVAAFTAAVAIHLSAVAIASLHQEIPISLLICAFTTVTIDPEVVSTTSSQTEIPAPTPPPTVPTDFVEFPHSIRSISKSSPILPIRTIGQTPMGLTRNAKASAIYAPRPEYPYEARSRHITGSGIAVMSVDPVTGFVENAVMEQSIGNSILDNSAINAFKRWQFKRGAARKIRIPIRFLITGPDY